MPGQMFRLGELLGTYWTYAFLLDVLGRRRLTRRERAPDCIIITQVREIGAAVDF